MKGRVVTLMSFTVADGRIAAMDIIVGPDRLAALDLAYVLS
jgi:RNA polymerase sigma-70 factor (ECF subfamily)